MSLRRLDEFAFVYEKVASYANFRASFSSVLIMAEESSHSQDLNNAFIIILFVPEKCCGLYWNEGCSLDLGSKNPRYIGMRVILECGFNWKEYGIYFRFHDFLVIFLFNFDETVVSDF